MTNLKIIYSEIHSVTKIYADEIDLTNTAQWKALIEKVRSRIDDDSILDDLPVEPSDNLEDWLLLYYFLDAEERTHVMVVNGSPCSWARITLKLDAKREKLFFFDVKAREFRELWPADPQNQLVTLAPGEGRLFRIGGAGAGVNF